MAGKQWKKMLGTLPLGEHTISFRSIGDIKSCKAIAYDINSDKTGRRYTFNVNKDSLIVKIKIEEN